MKCRMYQRAKEKLYNFQPCIETIMYNESLKRQTFGLVFNNIKLPFIWSIVMSI